MKVLLRRISQDGTLRACAMLGFMIAVLLALSLAGKVHLGSATVFSVLQNFATIGPVALGLGLTMLLREFDISIAGTFGLGGCIAVLLGGQSAWFGLVAAALICLALGILQGLTIVYLQLKSVAVTLGGLLAFSGLAYVLTGSRSLPYENLDVALLVNAPIAGIFSLRSLAAVALFVLAIFVVRWTRVGRDMIAVGSNSQAAVSAGVPVHLILVTVFAASAMFSGLSGALLSFSLSAASPSGLSDIAIPAVAAVLLGGASLLGGAGRPSGTAAGVLILSLLRTGLTALGISSSGNDLITGLVLLIVAISDGPQLTARLFLLHSMFRSDRGATAD